MLLRRSQWTHSVILENKIRKLKCWLNLCVIKYTIKERVYSLEALWTILKELLENLLLFLLYPKKIPTKQKIQDRF